MYSNTDNNSSSNIRFTPTKDNQFGSLADVNTRPSGGTNSSKDFKKVVRKTEREREDEPQKKTKGVDEEEQPDEIALNEEEARKEPPPSLFDLSGKQSGNSVFTTKEGLEQKPIESPSELFSKLSSKNPKKVIHTGEFPPSDHEVAETKKDKFTTRFSTEQSDLSYVNPLGLASQQANSLSEVRAGQTTPTLPKSQIQEMIDQMVKALRTIHETGKTDTMLTLKHPPVFDGVNVIISSYDSAKGEFNVAFENLTQLGKQLLDMRVNQDSLRQALEQKGYAVHIVVTTTLMENRPLAENTSQANSEQRERQEQQQQEKEKEQRQ